MGKRRGTTWRNLLVREMDEHSESFGDLVAITLTDAELDAEFDEARDQCWQGSGRQDFSEHVAAAYGRGRGVRGY